MCRPTAVPDTEAALTALAGPGPVWGMSLPRRGQRAALAHTDRALAGPDPRQLRTAAHCPPLSSFLPENAKAPPQSEVFAGPGTAQRSSRYSGHLPSSPLPLWSHSAHRPAEGTPSTSDTELAASRITLSTAANQGRHRGARPLCWSTVRSSLPRATWAKRSHAQRLDGYKEGMTSRLTPKKG